VFLCSAYYEDICFVFEMYCVSTEVLSNCQVAGITFNLWYRLSEELYQKNNDVLTALFKPYVERLIGALCRHCQMEPDHVS